MALSKKNNILIHKFILLYIVSYTLFVCIKIVFCYLNKTKNMLFDNNINIFLWMIFLFVYYYSIIVQDISIFQILYIIPFFIFYVEYNYCTKKISKENFKDSLDYIWGKYELDDNILNKDDEDRVNYSIARGNNNINTIKKSDLENTTIYLTAKKMFNKNMVFTKDSCGYGNWILPKIVDKDNPLYKNTYLCNNGCSRCDITTYGTYTDKTPRPLYTTSSTY